MNVNHICFEKFSKSIYTKLFILHLMKFKIGFHLLCKGPLALSEKHRMEVGLTCFPYNRLWFIWLLKNVDRLCIYQFKSMTRTFHQAKYNSRRKGFDKKTTEINWSYLHLNHKWFIRKQLQSIPVRYVSLSIRTAFSLYFVLLHSFDTVYSRRIRCIFDQFRPCSRVSSDDFMCLLEGQVMNKSYHDR